MNDGLTNIVVATSDNGVELLCPDCALRLYDDVATVELEPHYSWENNETDTPNHCQYCNVLLEQDLTPHGVQHVRDEITRQLAENGYLLWPVDVWAGHWQGELLLPDGERVINDEGVNFGTDALTDEDAVLAGYLDALLWTGEFAWMTAPAEFGGEPLAMDIVLDNFASVDDLPESVVNEAREDVRNFLLNLEYAELFDNLHEIGPLTMGHDLCLTRNGHGAGFWDEGLGELGDYLTHVAKGMGLHHLMGCAVLRDPKAADPLLLSVDNLDLSTLAIWSSN